MSADGDRHDLLVRNPRAGRLERAPRIETAPQSSVEGAAVDLFRAQRVYRCTLRLAPYQLQGNYPPPCRCFMMANACSSAT